MPHHTIDDADRQVGPPGFLQGVQDFKVGTYPLVGKTFFQLETEEERWRFHGYMWAQGRERYLAGSAAA